MSPSENRDSPSETRDEALLTVSQVARRAHVSVRTLHHYDEIGLLEPSTRSAAGYRLYGPDDLERLHQVLLFRELGLSLESIAEVLAAGPDERRRALEAHRGELELRRRRTDAVIRAVDRAIDTLRKGETMGRTQLFEGFEDFDHARYADEAEERWGETDAYRESQRRLRSYSKADVAAIKAEFESIVERMAALMREGKPADSPDARAVAEEHRQHIDRRFYDCPPAMHAGLADMYDADPRFAGTFESRAEGLAAFFSAAIRANADGGTGDRTAADSDT